MSASYFSTTTARSHSAGGADFGDAAASVRLRAAAGATLGVAGVSGNAGDSASTMGAGVAGVGAATLATLAASARGTLTTRIAAGGTLTTVCAVMCATRATVIPVIAATTAVNRSRAGTTCRYFGCRRRI